MTAPKQIEPAITLTAFNCPQCGALAKQFWWTAYADPANKDDVPFVVARDMSNVDFTAFEEETREKMKGYAAKLATGVSYLDDDKTDKYGLRRVSNLNISRCFNCNQIGIWSYDKMIWPVRGNAPSASSDLPADIRADYDEAATIADLSPRGAAALLRLAVQKLCVHLGGAGKNINDDIAVMVAGGLDKRVQQALDVVRVIGNNSVHPGQIDLRDDRATAGKLFALVNLIAEIMISQPKHVASMFDSLPDGAKKAIERRDRSAS